jgi:hypothetical protein
MHSIFHPYKRQQQSNLTSLLPVSSFLFVHSNPGYVSLADRTHENKSQLNNDIPVTNF